MTVADKVRSALARELKRDPATIAPEQALREDLGLNSLDAIELMFKVEEEFDLEIPDADLQRLRTVGDLVAYLEGRLGGAPAPAAGAAPPTPTPPRPVAADKPAPVAPGARSRTGPPAGDKRPAKRPRP
jgi:acyl carrier protein